MSNTLANYVIVGALASIFAVASPALAFRGGSGTGGGGMGGGMHAMMGESPRFSGTRLAGAPLASHAAFTPRFWQFGFHHRFHRFAIIGVPFAYATNYCWRRVWTRYGLQWVNAAFSSCDRSRRFAARDWVVEGAVH